MELPTKDLRYAGRRLVRTPGFTVVALVTLALAIGSTTAVFSIVNGVLLKPLGFTRPDRLVYVQSTSPRGGDESLSPQDMLDYRDQSHSFSGMAAVDGGRNLTLLPQSGPPMRISAARVGASFFSVLGVRAQIGRTFATGEDSRAATKVVVLSDHAWKTYFGGDPQILGRKITLSTVPYVVIGVAPPTLAFPERAELWYPAAWQDHEIGDHARGMHSIHAIARLRDGVTLASAGRDLSGIANRIAQAFPENDAGVGAQIKPLRSLIVGDVESPLWAMFGAVGFVLLIACANIANLLLVRGVSRQSEVAVRTALGAGRRQLLRQFMSETLLLTVVSAILGTLLAALAIGSAKAIAPTGLPRVQEIGIDGRVLTFSAALALATGLAFGLLPVLHSAGWDVAHMLRSSRSGAAGRAGRTRSVFVLTELALGTVLLVGAGLLIRSFERLTHVNPGFRADHLLVFDLSLAGKKYDYDAAVNALADGVQAQLSALPGVASVAVSADRPFDLSPMFGGTTSFTIDGAPPPAHGTEPDSRISPVSPNYFQTMGMSLVRGRVFTDDENRVHAAPVIVINEELARRYFPSENPIGKHLTFGLSHTPTDSPADSIRARGEIVGIVKSPLYSSLAEEPTPVTFFPYRTMPFAATFAVRTTVDPVVVEPEIRRVVAAVDPELATYELGTMTDALGVSVAQPRFYTLLLSAFGAVALLLAALGVYGVISYAVSQQTRDFGIRIALGARPQDIINLVIGRGGALIATGLAVGVGGAVMLTRLIRGLLFGVEPLDATTFGFVCLLFALVATVASWLPARRAASVDPVLAMRAE